MADYKLVSAFFAGLARPDIVVRTLHHERRSGESLGITTAFTAASALAPRCSSLRSPSEALEDIMKRRDFLAASIASSGTALAMPALVRAAASQNCGLSR